MGKKIGNLSNTKQRGQELRKYKMDRKWHFFSMTDVKFEGKDNTLTYIVDGKEKTVKLSKEAADNYWKYFRNCQNGYALDYLVEHGFKLDEGTYRVLKLSTRTSTPEEAKATATDIKTLFSKLLGVCGPSYHESVLKVYKVISEKILTQADNKNSICSKISIIKDIFFPNVEGLVGSDETIEGKNFKIFTSEYTNDKCKVFIDDTYKTDKLIRYKDDKITNYLAAIICKKMADDNKQLSVQGQIVNIVESFLNKGQKKNVANSLFFPVNADGFFVIDVFSVYGTTKTNALNNEKVIDNIITNYSTWSPKNVSWYEPNTVGTKYEGFKSPNAVYDLAYKKNKTYYDSKTADLKALSTTLQYLINESDSNYGETLGDLTAEIETENDGDPAFLLYKLSSEGNKEYIKKYRAAIRLCYFKRLTFDLTIDPELADDDRTFELLKPYAKEGEEKMLNLMHQLNPGFDNDVSIMFEKLKEVGEKVEQEPQQEQEEQKEGEQSAGISGRKLKKLGLKNWQVKKIKKIINNRVNETINEALKDKPKAGVTENDTLNEIKEMLKLVIGEDKTKQIERPTTIALTQQQKPANVKDMRNVETKHSFNPSDIVAQRDKLKPVQKKPEPKKEPVHDLKYEIEHFDQNKLNKTLKGLNKIVKKGELDTSAEGKTKALSILKKVKLNPVTANLIKIVGTGANPKTYKGGIFSDLLSFIPGGSAAFNIAKSVYNVAKPLVDKAINKYDEAYAKQSKKSKGISPKGCRHTKKGENPKGYMNSEQLKKYLINNQKPKLSELAKVLK